MNVRALWSYYIDVNIVNLIFSIFIMYLFNRYWAIFMFCTLGIFVGRFAFQYFKNNEYNLYYNLGFSKLKLLKIVWVLNLIIALPLFIIALAI
ncbi:hypothetical protein JM83_0243 [Gillisia sp. Hel_I_86]|uniref:hypothetical protein n=1 Tax=Gillisia sp. Hel_I_86 TaxID=1249981 RepID=UPI001199DB89|nr:hypothetical protein [Gillisia sp. Hel_I_86]TVZ25339.1 hypothetical protein JM83_0243 [Gillisia sp. Hel_I_86]